MADISSEINKIKELVDNSENIFVTSHISPDPDAVASLLLMGISLKLSFPDKKIKMGLEERPVGLDFLSGFDEIEFRPVHETLQEYKPDLFILLDGNNYERCSRQNGQDIRDFIATQGVKSVIIDHHELAGKDNADVFINRSSAAAVQDIYEILTSMGLKMSKNAAQTAMTGFYADTGGFVYVKAGTQHSIFGLAEQLVSAGADIEQVKYHLESYTEDDIKVLGQLALNVTHCNNYSYSFLSDDFINSSGLTSLELQRPSNTFLNNYIRNIDGRNWGFIVYKNTLQGDGYYSASFRSQGGIPDVSLIAAVLGGGGHKPAAGAKFEAASLPEALEKVKAAIEQA